MGEAYSSLGRTSVVSSLSHFGEFYLYVPLEEAPCTVCVSGYSMWEFQDRPEEMSIPKYLALVTASRTCPCRYYKVLIGLLEAVTLTTWHFEGLNSMSHLDSHPDRVSRSF